MEVTHSLTYCFYEQMYLSMYKIFVCVIHDCISKCIELKSLSQFQPIMLQIGSISQVHSSTPYVPLENRLACAFLKVLSSRHAQIFHIYKRKYLEQPESEASRNLEELSYNWITYLFPIFLLFRVLLWIAKILGLQSGSSNLASTRSRLGCHRVRSY